MSSAGNGKIEAIEPRPGTDFCPNCSETIARIRSRNNEIAELKLLIREMLDSVTGPIRDGFQEVDMNMYTHARAMKAIGVTMEQLLAEKGA